MLLFSGEKVSSTPTFDKTELSGGDMLVLDWDTTLPNKESVKEINFTDSQSTSSLIEQ